MRTVAWNSPFAVDLSDFSIANGLSMKAHATKMIVVQSISDGHNLQMEYMSTIAFLLSVCIQKDIIPILEGNVNSEL